MTFWASQLEWKFFFFFLKKRIMSLTQTTNLKKILFSLTSVQHLTMLKNFLFRYSLFLSLSLLPLLLSSLTWWPHMNSLPLTLHPLHCHQSYLWLIHIPAFKKPIIAPHYLLEKLQKSLALCPNTNSLDGGGWSVPPFQLDPVLFLLPEPTLQPH